MNLTVNALLIPHMQALARSRRNRVRGGKRLYQSDHNGEKEIEDCTLSQEHGMYFVFGAVMSPDDPGGTQS